MLNFKYPIFGVKILINQIFFSTSNKWIPNDEFLIKKEYQNYIKNLNNNAINLLNSTSKMEISIKFGIQKFFLNLSMKDLWKNQYLNFLNLMNNENLDELKKILEWNYFTLVKHFIEKLKNSNLSLELFTPKTPFFKLDIVNSNIYEGVFLERFLNYKSVDYIKRDNVYKLIRNDNLVGNYNGIIFDDDLTLENIPKMRKKNKVVQILLKIQTNYKLNLVLKTNKQLIYGSQDENLYETKLVQIESLRKFDPAARKLIITDIDEKLNGNPFVIN